ncbi:MAG: alpha/beta hydrolase [Clostridia bacterium]|nr:alpha/beta hydrolase [Clostridia bacterium]
MLHEIISLDKNNPTVTLEVFAYTDGEPRDAMLVIPGGGYGTVCSDREGEPIALAFLERGVNAFVLTYRVGKGHNFPEQLTDAARAVAYIRENAERYALRDGRVFTVGFSAGGHLSGTLATRYKYAERLLGLPENLTRPTGSVYAYPVVSAMCPTHGSSFENLSGKPLAEFTDEDVRLYSLEEHVTKNTPPAFIWHTATDEIVPVCGSLLLANTYINAGVSVTLHVYPYGTHGVALGNEITANGNKEWLQPLAEGWVDYAVAWMSTV